MADRGAKPGLMDDYQKAKEHLGWEDWEVADFFGYTSLASFRRSSAYKKRKSWFANLVLAAKEIAERRCDQKLSEIEARVSRALNNEG